VLVLHRDGILTDAPRSRYRANFNSPLKPGLALEADRVVVIGLNTSVTPANTSAQPHAIDSVAQLLQVVLADQLADDVATLATVNETLTPTASSPCGDSVRRGPRRTIPYIFVAPNDRFAIGRLAHDRPRRQFRGTANFTRPAYRSGLETPRR
jgi:hypothetical protein